MRRAFVALLFALAAATGERSVCAQPTTVTPEASARADALNRQAVEALKRDSFAEAEAPAREAWSLKQSYDIASNLGLAELGLKRYRDAAEHLSFALSSFPANGKPEHKRLVETSLAQAAAEVGPTTVTVSVDGATVFADDRRVGIAPLHEPVFLEPGQHTLRAEIAGYEGGSLTVMAERGKSTTVALTLLRSASGTPTTPPAPKSVPLIFVGFGLAAVGVAVGIGGAVASSSNSSSADTTRTKLESMGGSGACNNAANAKACGDLDSALKNVGTFRNLAITGFAVGGAALVGTVVYLAIPSRGGAQTTTGLGVGPGYAGWTLRRSF